MSSQPDYVVQAINTCWHDIINGGLVGFLVGLLFMGGAFMLKK